jgi:hypothetical protein
MSDLLERLQRHARTSIREPSEQDVEIERLRAEVARLQAVVDAALRWADADASDSFLLDAVSNYRKQLRALDGEVKP